MNILQRGILRLNKLAGIPGPLDDFWYKPVGGKGNIGAMATPGGSLALSVVDACISLISDSIAQLPCKLYEQLPDGDRRVASDHPAYSRLHDQASPDYTAPEFWNRSMRDVLTWGNAYSHQDLDSRGNVSRLDPLRPNYMRVIRDKGAKVFKYEEPGNERIYTESEIIQFPGRDYDGWVGYSPIETHRRAVELTAASQEYAARFFENNATPPQYLSFPQNLNPEARELVKKWFDDNHKGEAKWHKLGVLENGGKIESVAINHRDIQFLELRKFQTEEICRIFKVPPHMVGDVDRSTSWGSGIEQQQIAFIQFTLGWWIKMLESRVAMSILGPRERNRFFVEFSVDAFLRGDSSSRAEASAKRVNAGLMTPNEGRRLENLPRVEGGDELLINGTMVPISQAGKPQQGVPSAAN